MKTAVLNYVNNQLINPTTGEVMNIRYLPGRPLSVRFDASRGIFTINGRKPITEKGGTLSFIPVAVRIFRDDILGLGIRKWAEFFYLNDKDVVCNLLVHEYSVDNLMRTIQDMYYDEVDLCSIKLTITPIERINKSAGSKYYIADFSYEEIPEKLVRETQLKIKGIPVWRIDTFTGDAEIELAINYNPPVMEAPKEEVNIAA